MKNKNQKHLAGALLKKTEFFHFLLEREIFSYWCNGEKGKFGVILKILDLKWILIGAILDLFK